MKILDGGLNWDTIVNGSLGYLFAIYFIGDNVVAGSSNGLYLSLDAGITWTQQSDSIFPNDFADYNGILYAAGNGAYVSYDQGLTWSCNLNPGMDVCMCITVSQTRILIGTYWGGIFKSDDQGITWNIMNAGLPNKKVLCLIDKFDYVFVGTYYGGIFLNYYPDTTWTERNVGIINSPISEINSIGGSLFAGTCANGFQEHGNSIYRSEDNSDSWIKCDSGLPSGFSSYYLTSINSMGSQIIASIGCGGVVLSSDNGNSWQNILNGSSSTSVDEVISCDGNLFAIYHNSFYGLITSSDTGSLWSPVPLTNAQQVIKCYSDTIFVGGQNKIYFSTNCGISWSTSQSIYTGILTIASNASIVYASGYSIVRSLDHGMTWNPTSNGLPNPSTLYVNDLKFHGNIIYAATNQGVFVSHDAGMNWINCSANLMSKDVKSLAIKSGYLYAGTYGAGVWHMQVESIIGITDIKPTEKVIVYPNPAQDKISIQYKITSPNNPYQILDILGNTIQNGQLIMSDQQIICIGDLSVGMYFLQFEDNGIWQGVKFVKSL